MNQVMLEALGNELEKISEAVPVPEKKDPGFKKWLKNTAIIGGGVATGTAVGMVGHKALSMIAGPKWNALPASTQRAIMAPLIAGAGIGTALAGERMMRKRIEADDGE